YADVLEWDFSGQYVLYDAYNVIESTFGADIDYWDIGFLHVWNAYDGYWAGGNVAKLFSALPENTSVGNPTFAKNSDYIIAFDWIDNYSSSYELYGVNLQTGATGVIFDNPVLNYPNYSIDDERIAFNALDLSNNDVLGYIELNPDKISPAGNGVVLLDNRSQGVFFANGLRPLADEEVALPENALRAFPNPTGGVLTIELELDADATLPVEVVDLLGRSLQRQWWNAGPGRAQLELSLAQYPAGQYVVRVGRQSIRVYHP
ncbi:MAG: T9SS type A sorting domain-containing protein, partial [Saprospiraceae bacterium]|nr:T9SS type A sorting domain-containing protein [Saprospiraceae bacterium]